MFLKIKIVAIIINNVLIDVVNNNFIFSFKCSVLKSIGTLLFNINIMPVFSFLSL